MERSVWNVVEDVLHINYVSVSWPGCCGRGLGDRSDPVCELCRGRERLCWELPFGVFLFQWSVELEQFRLGSFMYLQSMYQWHSDVGLRLKFETLVLAKDKVTHCTVSEWVACVNDCCTEERCRSCPRGTSQSVAKKEKCTVHRV